MPILEISELVFANPVVVADRSKDLQLRTQRSQRDFETYLVVAGGGAAMCNCRCAALGREFCKT